MDITPFRCPPMIRYPRRRTTTKSTQVGPNVRDRAPRGTGHDGPTLCNLRSNDARAAKVVVAHENSARLRNEMQSHGQGYLAASQGASPKCRLHVKSTHR